MYVPTRILDDRIACSCIHRLGHALVQLIPEQPVSWCHGHSKPWFPSAAGSSAVAEVAGVFVVEWASERVELASALALELELQSVQQYQLPCAHDPLSPLPYAHGRPS